MEGPEAEKQLGGGGEMGNGKQLCIQDLPFYAIASDLSRTMSSPAQGSLP